MERRERRNAVTVLAPAKLNLALDVVGLLPNGYHALDMTMQTITLYERVVLRRSAGLSLQLPGSPVQPNDKNTAIKAALAFFHYTGLLAGVDIIIHKNTPVRAGMAGGSADAAAVLVGLNALYGAKLSMSELCALGAGIGSVSAGRIGAHAIWISCLLLAAFALMFIREDLEQNPLIEKDISAIRKETAEIDRTLKQELKEEQQELKENAAHKR